MARRSVLVCAFSVLLASSQSVISTHSGVVLFADGAVSIDGRAIPPVNGRFPGIGEGSVLRTSEGKAEILLGPETLLWLGPDSSIRMLRNTLADVRFELLEGSALLESRQMLPYNAVTLVAKGCEVRLAGQSLYRVDVGSSQLTVISGRADVLGACEPLAVQAPRGISLSSGLSAPAATGEPDGLERWALERRQAIAAANLARLRSIGLKARVMPARKKSYRRLDPAVMVSVPPRVR